MKIDSDIDSPLLSSREDTLGRGPYAARIARIVAARRGDHSAVFAIYGEWGSGKTSFKNFILEKLEQLPEHERPVIVEFNPWEWEGPHQVSEAFFAKLAEDLGTKVKGGAEISERLGRYASYFTIGASIAESAGAILPWFVPGVGPMATLLGKFMKSAGEQAKTGADTKLTAPPLSQLREQLVESIRKLERTILVTIDDVDRLTTAETAILFQLLKSNADFPNVIYLVLCDREVVTRNLRRVVAGRGAEYLEKIVQLGIPLPKAYPDQLRTEALSGMTSILRSAGLEKAVDHRRLYRLYDQYAEPFFQTMRDVKRFLANLDTLLPVVIETGEPTVDLVDFIGIELLRTFDHPFYETIYGHRERILGRVGLLSKDKEFLDELRGTRPLDSTSIAVFGELFPRFGPNKTLASRPRGISHRRAFDRYFAFSIPPHHYSPTEENVVVARRGREGFADDLRSAADRGRLQYLLELLKGAAQLTDHEATIQFIATLATFAETLHQTEGAADDDSYRDQIARVIYSSLANLQRPDRSTILVAAARNSKALWFPVHFESYFRRKNEEIEASELAQLRVLALDRIENAGESLEMHPAVGELLLWWVENGSTNDAKQYAENLLKTDDALLNLIRSFSFFSLVASGRPRKLNHGFRTMARQLNEIIPIERVLARIERIDKSQLRQEERELLQALRDDAMRMKHTDADQDESGNADSAPAGDAGDVPE